MNTILNNLDQALIDKNVATDIINMLQCLYRKENALESFGTRLENGLNWEKYTIRRIKNKYPDSIITHNQGKVVDSDIKAVINGTEYKFEIKADYKSNTTGNIYIKAYQQEYHSQQTLPSSLLCGGGHWIHYYKENNVWYTFTATKKRLHSICKAFGKLIEIAPSGQSQLGYILPVATVKELLSPKLCSFEIVEANLGLFPEL